MSAEDLESELLELFEKSAETPNGADLTRLRARAADVPERAPRTPRWLPRWVWAPALGGICAGAGALGALWFSESAPAAAQAPSKAPAVGQSARSAAAANAAIVSAAPSAGVARLAEEEDDDPLSFDLSADVADTELDDWLAALEEP